MHYDVCVLGLGYIGLPTSLLLADAGLQVLGVDVDDHRLASIRDQRINVSEPGLNELLSSTLLSGTLELADAPRGADAFIVAVPTPLNSEKLADLSYVYAAVDSIIPVLRPNDLVIIESTCPPSTTRTIEQRISSRRPDLSGKVDLAYCPERILPGNAIEELRTNDRTIGGWTDRSAERATNLYAHFCNGELLKTDATTAEMVKLTENAYRDVNIAFANELSLISDEIGVSPWEVIQLANRHPRVNILNPGPGVGGHCIAVDPWFIVGSAPDEARLIETARAINDGKPTWVIEKAEGAIDPGNPKEVVLLGLTFKPDIDDLRGSPALEIARKLADRNPETTFVAIDPNLDNAPSLLESENLTWRQDVLDLGDAQLIIWLVDHKEFKQIDWTTLRDVAILDTRGNQTRLF